MFTRLLLPLCLLGLLSLPVAAQPLADDWLGGLLRQCAPNVGETTLRATVQVESGGYPWIFGSNTKRTSHRFRTKQEAVQAANAALSRGENLDLGLGQINSVHLPTLGLSVDQVFEPCTNLQAAQALFLEKFELARRSFPSKPADQLLRHAISRYNTGSDLCGFANGYVEKVERAAGAPLLSREMAKSLPAANCGKAIRMAGGRGGAIALPKGGSRPAFSPFGLTVISSGLGGGEPVR